MFNGYNETPLISSYNDFDQEREKKQENGGKWSYGPDQFAQHHSNNRESEFWSPKPNLIGIPSVVNIPSKCNCSGCYSSPENQSYQGDSTRHRPWLPRTFPIPLGGSNESCKLPGYHQWDNVGLSSQGPCFSEGNPLPSQYLQENGGKHPYYRSYQNSRLPEPNQPGVITSVKNSDYVKKDVLLKQKDELPTNSTTHEMVFFGQNGTKQQMFCNPTYNLARNAEKRIDNRSCSSNYCDSSEKYSAMDSCRHSTNAASYGLEHVSRLPVVEPYMKTVPSNLNQNRVPSTGHRSLKENKSQSYIDQSYCDARKIICPEGNQAVNGNKNGRSVYPPAVVKEGTACENFQSGQIHNIPPPMAMDLKSSGVHIDYSHFNANRDFSRSCANMSESETQKYMFENNRHSEYFSRNSVSDVIKRNNQVPLLDAKKDCAITQIGQMNMSEQHCGNLPRSNHISNMPKYLEVGNSKSSCGVYYAKDYNGDKISKSDKFDQMPENPMTFQRSEDGLKNDNLNVHARIPRSALVFNDPRDAGFADRAQTSYSYQNNTIPYKNYVRSEYSYQGYNAQGRYEHPHVPHGVSGLQRNDPNQYNRRVISQQQPPNCGLEQFLPHANNSFVYDPHCQQSGNSEKNLPQQFCDNKNHSPASLIQVASAPAFDHHSVDVRLDLPLEVKKPNHMETIRAEDINKNGSSKISPLRLLRKKKFVNQKNETVLESIPSSNTPTDTVPALDVRKFWSTWAEEEDENVPTQMVVLDCQNIDPEQAKFLHLYENDPARTMRLENSGVVTLKGSSCDKDSSIQPNNFGNESQEVNIGYDQVSLLNEHRSVSPLIGKQNCENKVETTQQEDAPTVRKSFEKNSQVETLDTSREKMGSSEAGEIEPPNERSFESVDQKTETMSPKNDGKPCKRGRSRASQESKESYRSKKVNLEKKTENVNRLDKWTEKKFDFLKRAEESKAAEILRHEEEKKRIFERRLSFQQGNVTNEVKKISSNSKTPTVKEKLEMGNKEAKSSFTNPDFEKKGVNEIFKSLSPFDDNSISNSSEDSKGDLPHLPTSEYRRNKFLDYSEKKLFGNNSFSSSLENLKSLDLGGNGEGIVNEDTDAKGNENCVLSKSHHSLSVSETEEIKKEKLIKQECLTNNNWQSSEKYLTEKLGNNIFHSSLDESLFDNIKLKGESGLHSFVMEDILKKMSEINFQNPEVKSESIDKGGIMNALKSEVMVDKANKPNKRVKKIKKLEHQEESDERTDKLTVENISVSKPTIKFSIQKSHDLKISFKVLNSSKKYEKCESDEDAGRNEVEGKSDSVDESKNSTELITLKLKSVQRDGSNCDRSHKLSKKIPFSRNGAVLKKNRRRFRRKKIRGDGPSPLKTPVLKIKKSRYLSQDKERDPLAEDTDYEKCLNLSRKPCSDEYSTSDDFQVQETIDSAKIKLTFKRHRANFETEYKIDNNDDDEDDNNNNNVEDLQGDLEPEDKFKVVEFDNECPSVTKTRFKKKSKRNKHQGLFDEESVKSFKCEGEDAKETSEPNAESDFETIPKEGELKSVPEEVSVNSASLQDLFGEDENYNFNEKEEEEEELESTSRISPRILNDLPLIVPSFQTHGNYEENEEQTLNFPDVSSNCFLERESPKENSVENVSTGSESLIENVVGDFLDEKSKSEVKVNSPIGENHANDDNNKKEVSLIEVNINNNENGEEEERKCKNSCLDGTTDSPKDDETLQEYPSGTVRIGDAVKSLISAVGDSEKEANFEGVDIPLNNVDTSLGSIRTYSHENENKPTNFESDKNDSNTMISRDNDSFECEDLENGIDGMNYGEEISEASDDNNNNNNNNDDNAKQLICSGQNYEDEKSSEIESSDSSTNRENHSKNKSSCESEADKDEQVEKTYPTDSSLNYYCHDERAGEENSAEVGDSIKDSEYAETFSGKVDDWKNYSNSLISDVDDDLNDNFSNSYELEGNRIFDQVDSLLTTGKNFKEEDVEMDSRDLLNEDKFSAGENSTSLGLLDMSESQNDTEFGEGNTKSEDSKPGDELVYNEIDQDSREKVENETNASFEENDQEKETKSSPEVEYSVENDSQSVDKVNESCIGEHNICLNEGGKVIVDQADGSITTETLDSYSSPLGPKSVDQNGDNSRLGDDDDASNLKQISIGESDRDVKDFSEVPDSSKEENRFSATNCLTVESSSLVETVFSDIGCEKDQIGESSALDGTYGDSVADFISEFSEDQRKSSDALEENENFSKEVPESHSNDNELEEGEIVEEDSAGCSEEMLPEDVFVGMTREAKSPEEEADFDLRNSEGFCANNIDSPRKETETTVDALRQNGEESNGKHESMNILFDVNDGDDCKIKNSCRYFLEEIKFDKSRIRRRHSLKVETLGKLQSGRSERSTESQKFKFNKKMSPREKRSNLYNFKAQSCPPSVKFFNRNDCQVQIAVLDIPVEDIPLPPGDPPPENCFNFEEYFKKYKSKNEPKASGSNLDLEMYKPTEEKQSKEDRINPVISFNSPVDNTESHVEELDVTSKQLIPLKESKSHLAPSSANCKSPFMLFDLKSCRNPSPPSFKDKHQVLSTSNLEESSKNDTEPEEFDKSSEMVEFSSKEVKVEDLVTTKSEEIDWSPLKRDEGWQIDELDKGNVDSSVVLESPVQLVSQADTTQLNLHESIPFTQEIYDDITKSPVEVDINFENENVKTQTFSLPIFSNSEEEMTTANNTQDSDEINGTKEKDLIEQEEMEITDDRLAENEKVNESAVLENENCTVSEIKDEVSIKTSNAEADEIQNDYANQNPLKLICEDVDIEEMELRDLGSKTVDIIDDDALNVLGFENDDYIRNEFYECEDIPTSEDLPNGDQNEDDKVSDDDKFRNIMQNCLDNAKKFLNEGNLKLFSGSVDDLLELDCQMISENEAEKSTSDSANHISRDVLLTSCEDTVTDDLGLSQKFQPEDLSMDFVPSFCSDGTNNLCSEILPVDNWPYLEEEVPLSPTKPKQDETDMLPFLENVADEDNIPEYIDEENGLAKSQDTIPPVVNNGSFRTKKKTLSGTKGNTAKLNRLKLRRMTFPGLENSNFKRFRRKSLLTENQTFKMRSSITAQRRKTIDGFTGDVLREPSVKTILDDSGVVSELETEADNTNNMWQGGKSLKCRLSLEKLRNTEPYQDKYKNVFNTNQEVDNENNVKEIKTFSKDVKSLKSEESSKKIDPTHTISLKRKNFPKYKTSSWQPKVMLSRISQKELKRIRGKSNMETHSVEDKIDSKRNSQVDFLKEKAISEDDFESRRVDVSNSRPVFKKKRPNSLSESGEFEQDTDSKDLSEKPKLYVKSNSKNRLKYKDRTDEGQKINGNYKSSTGALNKNAFGSHKSEKATKHMEKENHRESEGSFKAQEIESNEEKLESPMLNSVEVRKHKKSRFRNLHSSKKREPHSNLNPLAKDISSPAQNILPLDDPKLVDAERVLSEIFRDCDLPQAEIINSPKKSTKGLLSNSKSEDFENLKRKLTVCKDETTLIDKKAKNSSFVDSLKNSEEHNARISSKSIHSKQNHSSSVGEKTVNAEREGDKEHSQMSNKHSRESSKRRRSESVHFHKDEKKEINEKGCNKNEERKEEKFESRERHKSDSERHSRHERKREKHDVAKDRRKESSRHNRHESSIALPNLKLQNKDRHSEGKNPKGFVRKSEENGSKGSPETEEKEKCEPTEPDLDSSWVCEVCGFDDASERIAHIKTHPFHCQSCHLAFKTESYFISHLTKKHKDIRNQHHCLLCELSFDTEEQYQHHLETREHRHLESVEKNTINTLFTLLTGQPCPVLGLVEMKPEWLPNQAGTVHFYHQATPLSLALQYLKMHHDLSSSSTVASAHLN